MICLEIALLDFMACRVDLAHKEEGDGWKQRSCATSSPIAGSYDGT
jgi:hypothetical protein